MRYRKLKCSIVFSFLVLTCQNAYSKPPEFVLGSKGFNAFIEIGTRNSHSGVVSPSKKEMGKSSYVFGGGYQFFDKELVKANLHAIFGQVEFVSRIGAKIIKTYFGEVGFN